ncbi:hypothetical protein BCU36_006350 [Vibrio lentus]|uniref:hypothetical protein n=1 Tax=Vibrio lentus TaxID=136468 RepID=UPI000C8316B3|nr:hypothetical protein [Vibrio lentus]PMI78915.1 hypothetical protein BCU36_03850 [Vibrio lentus]
MIRQSIITIWALSCSWSAMAECPEHQVCSNHTPAISGHGYPTDMPVWNVAPSENNTIGTGPISVRPIQDLDPDGDEVIGSSKTYHWCNGEGECFANSPTLTINPSDIDKVFNKGVGFKPLTVTYSGKVEKGYPEATRSFESEALLVALSYPPDGTIGICYEAGNKAVQVMALNNTAIGDHTHYLQFPNMALGSLPGQLSQVANGQGINFTSAVNAFIPTFQEKALPEQLTVQYCHDDCKEWAEFEVTKEHPGPGAPTIYNAQNIGLVSDGITVDEFNFQIAAQSNTDYRTNMVHCTQF